MSVRKKIKRKYNPKNQGTECSRQASQGRKYAVSHVLKKYHRFLKQKLNRFLCILSPNRQITQSNLKIGIKLFYRRGKIFNALEQVFKAQNLDTFCQSGKEKRSQKYNSQYQQEKGHKNGNILAKALLLG